MNKATLIAKIAEKADLNKKQAEAALTAFTDTVAEALKEGGVFCRNGLWESTVLQAMLIDGGTRIAVATSSSTGLKDAVDVVYVDGAKIIHETYGTYFSEDGVRKAMTELQGLEWTGGDVFDDYC